MWPIGSRISARFLISSSNQTTAPKDEGNGEAPLHTIICIYALLSQTYFKHLLSIMSHVLIEHSMSNEASTELS